MPRKNERKAWAGNPNDPEGLTVWVRRYLEHQQVRNYSEMTVVVSENHFRGFVEWCFDRGIHRPSEITKPILEAHQRWLFYYRKKDGKPLGYSTQRLRLTLIKQLFRWLVRSNVIPSNPASELELPRREWRIPRAVLSEREVEKVIAQADLTETMGLRDRAMMEVLYSTGLRRSELVGLYIIDVDFDRKAVLVRLGKGKRDRVVPIGERALYWVGRYLDETRPKLVVPPDMQVMFLTEQGERVTPDRLTHLMRAYVEAAEIGKPGAVHIFRHSMATLLLEGGADIRTIQEMLGHSKLDTTEIYTRVSVERLKVMHETCHPGAKLEPRKRREPATSAATTTTSANTTASAAELLAALDAEDDEAKGVRAER